MRTWRPPSLVCLLLLCGTAVAQQPTLRLERLIGDLRGCGMDNQSVAVTDDGRVHLLMRSGRVAVFGPEGGYLRSLQTSLPWPPDRCYLAARGRQVFVGDLRRDCPWLFAPEHQGAAPGRFQNPAGAGFDEQGQLWIADTGNRRLQLFSDAISHKLVAALDLPAAPRAVAVRGQQVAVLTDDRKLRVYRYADGKLTGDLQADVGPGGIAVAIGPDGSAYVATDAEWACHQLLRFPLTESGIGPPKVLAPSFLDQWPNFFPAAVPLCTAPDGQVWFGTDIYGAILSLDPKTDTVQQRLGGVHRPVALGFDAKGQLYVTGFPPAEPAQTVRVFSELKPEAARAYPGTGAPLSRDVPLWGLLPSADGGLYVRVIEEGYRKGWPALTFKRVMPDGRALPFLDLGELYARRRTFHPAEMAYSLKPAPDGNLLLAALPYVAVLKLTPEGRVVWEASRQPQGGADEVAFLAPRDVAADRRGNTWVVDGELDRLLCLSPAGKLLLSYGGRLRRSRHAGLDDREGRGFSRPTGVAVTSVGDREFVYVGDAGNQRLVKFEITWP